MFAQAYFKRTNGYRPFITIPPHQDTSLIIVIPCLREPGILETLDSLSHCHPPRGKAEVIILINEPENCPEEVTTYNQATFTSVQSWMEGKGTSHLAFYPVGPVRLPAKWAGVGLARKAGMDEALYRFDLLEKPGGIIVSLDADTLVDDNYLTAIEDHFHSNPAHVGATIRFNHNTSGFPEKLAQGIRLYEQYMHYYKNASAWAGYPHALYTIGSAFAVTALAYMRRGGMTRRQAGEDFYFLQTLTQVGKVGEIDATCVYPSARVSQRVPFGTGPAMKKWMDGSDELYYTFDFAAFRDLKTLFVRREQLYKATTESLEAFVSSLPSPIAAFIREEKLGQRFLELSSNCSTPEVFKERFFQVFNAFKILKFLHFSHPRYYARILLEKAVLLSDGES